MADTKPADSKAADQKAEAKKVMARVLVNGAFGKINDVVELMEAEVDAGEKAGELDGSASAVSYAKSLAKKE